MHLVETRARLRRGLDDGVKCMPELSVLGNKSLFCSGRFSLSFPPDRNLLGLGIIWAWWRMDCLSLCDCRTCSPVAWITSTTYLAFPGSPSQCRFFPLGFVPGVVTH